MHVSPRLSFFPFLPQFLALCNLLMLKTDEENLKQVKQSHSRKLQGLKRECMASLNRILKKVNFSQGSIFCLCRTFPFSSLLFLHAHVSSSIFLLHFPKVTSCLSSLNSQGGPALTRMPCALNNPPSLSIHQTPLCSVVQG